MKKNIILILVLVVVSISLVLFLNNKKEQAQNQPEETYLSGGNDNNATTDSDNNMQTNTNGLKIETLKDGTGQEAKNGDRVAVHYTGYLENGTKFDSSIDRGQPFVFTLGAGQVIQGWDLGVLGMKVGEKRKLIIPPDLAYGSSGAGGVIPPNAALIFEVELLAIQ